MKFELPSTRKKRRSILKRVYEENLRIDRLPDPERRVSSSEASDDEEPRASGWGSYAAWGSVVVVLLAFVGVAYFYFGLGPLAGEEAAPGHVSAQPSRSLLPADVASPEATAFEEVPALEEEAMEMPLEEVVAPAELSVARLFGLQVRTIVIDAGHGGDEEGAIGPSGLEEKEVTLDVARRLRKRLEQHSGYRVLMTREWDHTLSLRERVKFANTQGADFFISIHVNSLPVERVTSIETYYFGQGDEEATELARQENQNSDYSVAEFNEMIQEFGSAMRLQESRRAAGSIQRNLYENVRKLNAQVDDWGVRTAPFVVLLGVEAPSVLAEIGVISNRAEEEKLRTRAYREQLAAFLEAGIVDYINRRAPTGSATAHVSTDSLTQHGSKE